MGPQAQPEPTLSKASLGGVDVPVNQLTEPSMERVHVTACPSATIKIAFCQPLRPAGTRAL